ncbi:MAG: YtxH domain-containing protein [Elusimicrobia bacterium]|nr:YtxH domain-containing protein [Elusimicrobiota bacterium]
MENEKSRVSPLWYALGGAAIGVVLGVLYAPMKGSELRLDIAEWRRKTRDKKEALMRKLSAMIPFRVKAAAAMGALKAGGAEAIEIVKKDLNLDGKIN